MKRNVTLEIEETLIQKIEEMAEELGIGLEDWCSLAITQQINMQESMEDFMLQAGNMGLNLEELDFETIANQLFSSFNDLSDDEVKIILPDHIAKKDHDVD